MNQCDGNRKEKWIMGKIAEIITSELLRDSGFKVFAMGYEHTLKELTQMNNKEFNRESKTARLIRQIPDFVVVDAKGEPFTVEVKYRSHTKDRFWFNNAKIEELELVLYRWNALILLMTDKKPYFRIINKYMIGKRKSMPLQEYKMLSIPAEIINAYECLVDLFIIQPGLNKEQA